MFIFLIVVTCLFMVLLPVYLVVCLVKIQRLDEQLENLKHDINLMKLEIKNFY